MWNETWIENSGENKVGTKYAIMPAHGCYGVFVLSHNYSAGRTTKSWKMCQGNMNLVEAERAFEKKLNGKTKR